MVHFPSSIQCYQCPNQFPLDDEDIEEILRYTGLDSFQKFTDMDGEYDLRLLTLPDSKTPKQFGAMKAYFDQKHG